MRSLIGLLFVVLVLHASCAGQDNWDQELSETISRNVNWESSIRSRGLTAHVIRVDRHSTGTTETHERYREDFNSENLKFRISRVVGANYLDNVSNSIKDELVEEMSWGERGSAFNRMIGSGEARIQCDDLEKSCFLAARGADLKYLAFRFVLPIDSRRSGHVVFETVSFLGGEGAKKVRKSIESEKFGGRSRSILVYRVTGQLKVEDSNEIVNRAYRISVANDGLDNGRILSVKYGALKDNVKVYDSDNQVTYFERTVDTTWEVEKVGDKTIAVPVLISAKFFSRSDGKTVVENSEHCQITWEYFGDPTEESLSEKQHLMALSDMKESVKRALRN